VDDEDSGGNREACGIEIGSLAGHDWRKERWSCFFMAGLNLAVRIQVSIELFLSAIELFSRSIELFSHSIELF
jgi:hypothetical protein